MKILLIRTFTVKLHHYAPMFHGKHLVKFAYRAPRFRRRINYSIRCSSLHQELGDSRPCLNPPSQFQIRVAPTKTVSLPRLELLAAVVNAGLLKVVAESLTLRRDRVVCWTDSMVTLQWIRGSSWQWKTFVANRVTEIQSTWDGIDFAGPLFVRGSPTSKKAYICIFTCAYSRMTHAELSDLSTNEFFQVLTRMISRRVLCCTIWPDNAKTFKHANREIQMLFTQESYANKQLWDKIDQEEPQAKLTSRGFIWRFIFESSPWLVGKAAAFREGTASQGLGQGIVALSRVGDRSNQN